MSLRRTTRRFFTRPTELHARDMKVYAGLIDHLHSDVASVIGGIIGIMALAWFSHLNDSEHGFFSMMLLFACVGAMRLIFIFRYRKTVMGRPRPFRETRKWELIYGAGALIFASILGVFAIKIFANAETHGLRTITIAAVVGYAGGVAGRNAGRTIVAIGQVMASCLPLAAYLIVHPDGTNLGLAILLLIYTATLLKIVKSLNSIV